MPNTKTGTVQTLVNIPQAVQGPFPVGSPFVSGNFLTPSGVDSVQIQFNILEADLEDATKTFNILWIRNSDGLVITGFNWQGGSVGKDGTFVNPNQITSAPPAGILCHVEITMPLSITLGVTVTGF